VPSARSARPLEGAVTARGVPSPRTPAAPVERGVGKLSRAQERGFMFTLPNLVASAHDPHPPPSPLHPRRERRLDARGGRRAAPGSLRGGRRGARRVPRGLRRCPRSRRRRSARRPPRAPQPSRLEDLGEHPTTTARDRQSPRPDGAAGVLSRGGHGAEERASRGRGSAASTSTSAGGRHPPRRRRKGVRGRASGRRAPRRRRARCRRRRCRTRAASRRASPRRCRARSGRDHAAPASRSSSPAPSRPSR
jgi:hypothetical protein